MRPDAITTAQRAEGRARRQVEAWLQRHDGHRELPMARAVALVAQLATRVQRDPDPDEVASVLADALARQRARQP